jgi:hypothetical protein
MRASKERQGTAGTAAGLAADARTRGPVEMPFGGNP